MIEIESQILERITEHFVRSQDFNGILGSRLAQDAALPWPELTRALQRLVVEGRAQIAFYRFQDNPHILRLPPPEIVRQVELLTTESPDSLCIYPSPTVLATRPDLAAFDGRPFTKRLAVGEPQLTPVFFELSVLEYYHRDPRYNFDYYDTGGRISIRDEAYRASDVRLRDKIILDTFGIAYDAAMRRVVVVYLRYLSDLTPEHQQVWATRTVEGDCRMNSDYARATIYGEWPENRSAYEAILAEMAEINRLAVIIGKAPLFNDDFARGRPERFHPMLHPTQRNFLDFSHLLDKMLSENINREFFRGEVPLEEDVPRADGKVQVVQIGTLRLLQNWFEAKYRRSDGADVSGEIVGPFKHVRQLRQGPAHTIEADKFDDLLPEQQDSLVIEVLGGLQKLRWALMSHPKARRDYQPPEWLDSGKIVVY